MKYIKITCVMTSCVMLFIIFVITSIVKSINTPPFQMEQDYLHFVIDRWGEENYINVEEVKEQLRDILRDRENISIVKIPEDYSRVYLYDPSGAFSGFLTKGSYFNKEEFLRWHSNAILINVNSPYHRMMKHNTLYDRKQEKKVIGTYSDDSPFKITANGCSIVETLSNDVDLVGKYYISNCDTKVGDEIVQMFENVGYRVSIVHSADNKFSITQFLNVEMITVILSLFIVTFANYITLGLLFIRVKKFFRIHFYFGADFGRLWFYIFKEAIGSVIMGVLLGTIFAVGIHYFIYGYWSFFLMSFSFLISNAFMISIIFVLYRKMYKSIIKEGN